MKKFIYSSILFFCLFIGINSVKAVPKTVFSCTYSISSSHNAVLEIYKDSETSALTTAWVDMGTSSSISFSPITITDATKCPTVYYVQKEVAGTPINSINGEKTTGCNTLKCTETALTGVKKEVTTPSPIDVDDNLNKTLMLTCNYDKITLKIYDDKSFVVTGGEQCIYNKKTLDTLECPKFGKTTSNYLSLCYYNFEGEAASNSDSEFELTSYSNTQTYEKDYGKYFNVINGEKYGNLICSLRPFLLANQKFTANQSSLMQKDGTTLVSFEGCEGKFIGNPEQLDYYTGAAIKDVANYCNELYSNYSKYKSDDNITARMDECVNFDTFYDQLVKNKIVNDLSGDCGFISTELADKIEWVFDIMKIAGPVLAILLGSLDFIKVIASGEADKEMKTAGKRLLHRFIAAILLFIIPVILAWIMDLVLAGEGVYKGEGGYESNNPFCGVVKWSDKE